MQIKETIRLYDEDAYLTEFEATVMACEEEQRKDDKVYQVCLDQTLFFPEEGGQSPDMGTLNGIEVIDVQIKEAVIVHTLTAPLAVGTAVKGVID